MTDDSIIEMLNEAAEENSDEDVTAKTVPVMTHAEGLAALDTALRLSLIHI